MSISNIFVKDPNATLDYKFDWKAKTNNPNDDPTLTDWLESGEIISYYTISASPISPSTGSLTVVDSYVANSNTSVIVWVSGGSLYNNYKLECHIITSASPNPRVDERYMVLQIKDR